MSAPFRIVLDGLCQRYGDRTVLDIDSLEFDSGRSYALLGANGSGKSTLLKILSGVLEATGGCVDVAGERSRGDISVGYMPQDSFVFGFSVLRNVEMAARDAGLGREEVRRRAIGALAAVGMDNMLDARGNSLSGGEAQRVSLARILVRDLDVVLLDEPTSALDVAGTQMIEDALRAYRERTGCLLIAATHAPSQARRISDSVLVLDKGEVVGFGETDDVLLGSADNRVRTFLSHWQV
ncbi:MAG: ABC transporter ATP-binding protein [Coriobacteriales bacterium]|jgi:ABC-type multidrug transport system ATPase subunit